MPQGRDYFKYKTFIYKIYFPFIGLVRLSVARRTDKLTPRQARNTVENDKAPVRDQDHRRCRVSRKVSRNDTTISSPCIKAQAHTRTSAVIVDEFDAGCRLRYHSAELSGSFELAPFQR